MKEKDNFYSAIVPNVFNAYFDMLLKERVNNPDVDNFDVSDAVNVATTLTKAACMRTANVLFGKEEEQKETESI